MSVATAEITEFLQGLRWTASDLAAHNDKRGAERECYAIMHIEALLEIVRAAEIADAGRGR